MSTPYEPQDPNGASQQGSGPSFEKPGNGQDQFGQNSPYGQGQFDQTAQYGQDQYGQPVGGAQYGQGYDQQQYGMAAPQGLVPENKKAMQALIMSIVGLFCCFVLSIVGIVFGMQAKKEIAASGGAQTGEGKAKAAIIVGAVGLVLNLASSIWYLSQR